MALPSPPGAPTWIDRLGLTPGGQALLFVAATGAFLAAPDADLLALPLLHHRSILTHSLLPALLVLLARRSLGTAPFAGACLGVSVHLSADLLSPSVGYGQVWLPEPWQEPLGPWSRPWLALNALAGSWLAVRTLAAGPVPRAGAVLAAATAVAAALGYGVLNEGSLVAAALALAVQLAGLALHRGLARVRP